MQPLLLCIHMEPEKLTRVSMLSLSLGIKVIEVKKEDYGQTLSALCGIAEKKPNPPSCRVLGEMMVMAFFPGKLLDDFLSLLRKNGIPPIPLKAVLTEHNQAWHLGQMYLMLSQEAMMMEKGKNNR